MKKIMALVLVLAMVTAALAGCGGSGSNSGAGSEALKVGVCQLMVHPSLDQATKGFEDALTAEVQKAGKTVDIDTQVAGEPDLCTTVINTSPQRRLI